jgi:hypothetical protein
MMFRFGPLSVGLVVSLVVLCGPSVAAEPSEARHPTSDVELRDWLVNMIAFHRFTDEEITAATGLGADEIAAACRRLGIERDNPSQHENAAALTLLPYPGGRHPRIGFLEGAIRPQRETKFSVFVSWDPTSYVVADVPEAIFSNLGLTYLAHTHIDTIWTRDGIELEPLEWHRRAGGGLDICRELPNGIAFGAVAVPGEDAVLMELWLRNGTGAPLGEMRVQNCIMLKGAPEFAQQTGDNKKYIKPYALCRDESGRRWVIVAWTHCGRAWGNTQCPCLHSDPVIPDCPPGETRRVVGRLSFYEGHDVDAELARIDATGWQDWKSDTDPCAKP